MPRELHDAERWKQVEALYHAARARPSAERAAFLINSCPDDDVLRREVESLLGQPESGEGFLDQPALARAAGLITTPPASSMTGRSLGGYHLRLLLGAGGMGEVYLARDAKLGRDVAIKILPAAVVNDAGRLGRFDREARMLAALNHPNICAIYGFEEADGLRFLILELVDGETLADKLARISRVGSRPSGLPLVEALAIARQVADALDVAHEKGIVHRDLKPANIKITAAGVVKVLDFGLAKADGGSVSNGNASHVPTVTLGGTQEGAVLGTPAYMSPEQARGRPVDKRSDIWAFGCVLYEMLSGRVAFAGETAADTIAGILEREHDSAALPPGTPASIRKVIAGCLTKDPKHRIRDIGDVRIALDDTSSAAGEGAARSRVRERVKWQVWLPWALVSVLTIVIAGMVAWISSPPPAALLHRNKFVLPEGQTLDGSLGTHTIALSPNGLRTAFVARVGSSSRLYLRENQNDEIKEVSGAPVGVREPVFSPDSLWIAFYAVTEHMLKKIAVTGGEPITICPIGSPFGMNWGPDGSIVVGQGANGILRVEPEANSQPITIVTVENTEQAHGPQILPGGKYVLFTLATDYTPATGGRRDRWDKAQIFVQELGSAKRKPLFPGSDARYLETQKLIVYARGGRLYAVRFDLDRLQRIGAGVDVVRGVSRATGFITGAANYSIAEVDGGTIIHAEGPDMSSPAVMNLALITRGADLANELELEAGAYTVPRMSPDGTTVAFTNDMDAEATVWTYSLSGKSRKRVTSGRFPIWAGNLRIAFQDGTYGISMQAADGSGAPTPLTTPDLGEVHIPDAWSPVSQTLLYTVKKGPVESPEYSLWTLTLGGAKKPFRNVHSSSLPAADYSPDGQWIGYVTTEGGVTTISVEPSSGTGLPVQMPQRGTDTPKHLRWSRVLKEIFYDPRYGDFEAYSYTTNGGFAFGASKKLPKHPFQLAPPGDPTPYDVTKDDVTKDDVFVGMVTWGQRRYVAPIPQTFVHVTQNWFDTLQAQVPYR